MEPISLGIIAHIFIDQFIAEEGYGRLKKLFFPAKKYKNQLIKIIYKTIEEFESVNPITNSGNKFPFYHSQILFDELNKFGHVRNPLIKQI